MQSSQMSKTEAAAVAAEAFVFGYPLVLSERVRVWMTDVSHPDPVRMKAPVNAFVHARGLPETTAEGGAALHADTLRSNAWLDLSDGPVVLSVPETHGRYYAMSVVDLWTNVFASIGARSTGSTTGAYAFVAPRGSGAGLPASVLPVAAPTRTIRIAALTQVDDASRAPEAHAVQDGFRLVATGRGDGRDPPDVEPSRGRTQPVDQVERMDAATFFGELARLMHDNPPRLQDRRVIERMQRVGLVRDLGDGWDALDADTRSAVERGVECGLGRVMAAAEAAPGEPVGDWRIRFRLGDFGTDYLARAGAACAGLEPGPAADELPALLQTDSRGRRLWGRHRYVLRFPPGGLPPVHALWTLTTYDDRLLLVDNPTDRYSIGDWNGLTLDRDGSLPIAIQHKRPSGEDADNWLPAPPGRFNILLRLIWPMDEVLHGGWTPPDVVRVA
jgi:hypothetical protein